MTPSLWTIAIVLALLPFGIAHTAAPAAALPGVPLGTITMFGDAVHHPKDITAGPDGALWFANYEGNSIGRITTAGDISKFTHPGIRFPRAITTGPDGNLWFANSDNSIGRISTSGAVAMFTIPTPGQFSANDLAAGPDGNIWFTMPAPFPDYGWIGRITPAGVVSGFTHPNITHPFGITLGPGGNLWFANDDADGSTAIGQITPTGTVSTFALPPGYHPGAMTAGPDGNVWFTNAGPGASGAVGRITPSGAVANFPSPGGPVNSITAGPDGNLWFPSGSSSITRMTPDGVQSWFTDLTIQGVGGIVSGPDGAVWFASSGNSSIGRITPAGALSSFTELGILGPTDITTGADGNLWFLSTDNSAIGQMSPDSTVTLFTGPGIDHPSSLTTGSDGNLWFANPGELGSPGSIGRITPAGQVTTFSGPEIASPRQITAGPDGNLWFTRSTEGNQADSLGTITMNGVATSYAGTGIVRPGSITTGPDGNLWFTDFDLDTDAARIGRITLTGTVSTFDVASADGVSGIIAGPDGQLWFNTFDMTTGGMAIGRIATTGVLSADLIALGNRSGAVVVGAMRPGPDGNVWLTDQLQNKIGRVTPSGAVTYFAAPGTEVPTGIAVGPDGNMWFTSRFNNAIGRITTTGIPGPPGAVSAIAGATSAAVAWEPADPSGLPITSYTVTASPGGATCTWSSGPLSCVVTGLTTGTTYTFQVRATNADGTGPDSLPSNPVIPWPSATFHPVVPFRVLDSRTPMGGWDAMLIAPSSRDLAVAGIGPVPAGATSVVMNVTVTEGDRGSYVRAWPAGKVPPISSNLNFGPGETIANLVTVMIGDGGMVSFHNAFGSVHVVADVVGYYDDGNELGSLFTPTAPSRILDSRTPMGDWNEPLEAATPRDVQVLGTGGVPATATAIVANVTATNGDQNSFVSVWPSGSDQPDISTLNFAAGQTIANLDVVAIGSNGKVRIANAIGSVDVVVDVVGYFDPTSGSRFHALAPTRLLDSRRGDSPLVGPWGASETRTLPLAGAPRSGIAPGATAVVANVTATQATAGSYATLFPAGETNPATSNLNFGPSQTIANLTVTGLGAGGAVDVFNALGTVHLVADAAGYFSAT